ncbi:MAG: polysaccharide deacetylase family protein [Bacillota bacterium]
MKKISISIIVLLLVLSSGLLFGYLQMRNAAQAAMLQNEELEAEKEDLLRRLNEAEQQVDDLQRQLQEARFSSDKIAYLTFDDGPSAVTARILDILGQYDVKATFFVIGTKTEFGKQMYSRIVDEGHAIGLHGYVHDYAALYESEESFMNNMYRLQDLIREVTGHETSLVRFPGGSSNSIAARHGGEGLIKQIIQRLHSEGFEYFDWNVSSLDATKPVQSADVIARAVIDGVRGRKQAVILMHDAPIKTTTADALPAIIEGLRAQGFEFRALSTHTTPVHHTLR